MSNPLTGVFAAKTIARFQNRERISDKELQEAIEFLQPVVDGLYLLGERHQPSWWDLMQTLDQLKESQQKRAKK